MLRTPHHFVRRAPARLCTLEGLYLEIASPFGSRCPEPRAAAAMRASARLIDVDSNLSCHHPTRCGKRRLQDADAYRHDHKQPCPGYCSGHVPTARSPSRFGGRPTRRPRPRPSACGGRNANLLIPGPFGSRPLMGAALYTRSASIPQQSAEICDPFTACRSFTDSEGIKIVADFEDAGLSGSSSVDRPGFLNLMQAARSGTVPRRDLRGTGSSVSIPGGNHRHFRKPARPRRIRHHAGGRPRRWDADLRKKNVGHPLPQGYAEQDHARAPER